MGTACMELLFHAHIFVIIILKKIEIINTGLLLLLFILSFIDVNFYNDDKDK